MKRKVTRQGGQGPGVLYLLPHLRVHRLHDCPKAHRAVAIDKLGCDLRRGLSRFPPANAKSESGGYKVEMALLNPNPIGLDLRL
jgi:hypothetical protein